MDIATYKKHELLVQQFLYKYVSEEDRLDAINDLCDILNAFGTDTVNNCYQ